jgi:type IX secretion system PorP/SprF family membrane protein
MFSNIRQQWIGINGAPEVFNIQASEYIHDLRSAFGISLVGDKIGATRSFNPMISYAFRISGKQDWALSMGISGGLFNRVINGALYEADNSNDPSIAYDKEHVLQPDVNAGVEFQSTHYIFGLSSTHLYALINPTTTLISTNHRYGYAIYKSADPEFFNYSVGLQIVNRYNLTVYEGNVCFRFKRPTGLINGPKEVFDVGMTLRTSRQMTLLFGLNITPNMRAGYAYDQSFSSDFYLNTTHEIMLEYRIPTKAASTKLKCGNSMFWYH